MVAHVYSKLQKYYQFSHLLIINFVLFFRNYSINHTSGNSETAYQNETLAKMDSILKSDRINDNMEESFLVLNYLGQLFAE